MEKTEENPQNDTFSRGQDTRLFFGHFSRPVTVYSFLLKEIDEDAPLGRRLSELGKALGAYANEKFIHRAGYKPYSAWGNFYNLSEFAYHTLNIPATTFETSYYEAGEKVLTIEQYHKIGAIFAEQMCEFAKRG